MNAKVQHYIFYFLILGNRLYILLIEDANIHRSRYRGVLSPPMERRVRGDARREVTLQLHSSHHSQRRHLPYMHHILQRVRYGCGYVVPLLL